ncbi:YbaB/EbfC family nucleoid-associated protein [Catenulispora sp. NL8]|uniref:YbaB/EbfC family nucleoid-associated protein n=1 Tax=Catenulispora pinistramenti TaxID=2705254 RepID=A0ABS5KLB0_9ACTN|nr:YbaB/EbfC family nucleoid-associated protein [Catenulispora pinistramenti]MBS2546821.1 YbaB/EbfC family nucleoid-associated protein [Catenulispora pinistramenti]
MTGPDQAAQGLIRSADGKELLTRAEAVALGPTYFDQRIADAMQRYQRAVADTAEAQRRLTAVRVSKTSKKRELTVTVDARGRLIEAKFSGRAHRELSAVELSKLVTETMGAAQAEAQRQAVEITSVFRPARPRVDIEEIFKGGFPSYPPAAGDQTSDVRS